MKKESDRSRGLFARISPEAYRALQDMVRSESVGVRLGGGRGRPCRAVDVDGNEVTMRSVLERLIVEGAK